MVEMKYDEKNGDFKLPKNIRQVGQSEGDTRIYVEDYVVTFLNERAKETPSEEKLAILLGNTVEKDDQIYIFIHGAVAVEHINIQDDHIGFTSGIWTGIYEDIEKYFGQAKVAGWFLTRPGKPLKVTDQITKVHTDNFPGDGKLLMMIEPVDCEEQFYIYRHGTLELLKGYYIYYERNEAMQGYMIDYRKQNEDLGLMSQVIEEMLEDNPKTTDKKETDKKSDKKSKFAGVNQIDMKQSSTDDTEASSKQSDSESKLQTEQEIQRIDRQTKHISKMTRYAAVFAFLVIAASAAAVMKRYELRQNQQTLSTGVSSESNVAANETESYVSVWTTSEDKLNSNDNTVSEDNISTASEDSSTNTLNDSGQLADEAAGTVDNQNSSDNLQTDNQNLNNQSTNSQMTDSSNSDKNQNLDQQEAKDVVTTALHGMKYTVKDGDTLAEISEHYYASIAYVNAICALNEIDNADKIYPGMEITLP